MATLRIDYAGAWHHITNRASRHGPMFLDDEDRRAFLDILAAVTKRFDLRVCAWSLMTTHYHLLVHCPTPCISKAMQLLQSRYARYFNRRYNYDGPLFRGRFVNRVIEDVEYLRYVTAYVHLNVFDAHHYDDARWTTHRCYIQKAEPPAWLSMELIEDIFGDRYPEYIELVHQRRIDPEPMLPNLLQGRTTSAHVPPATPPRPSWSLDDATSAFEQVLGTSPLAPMPRPTRWLAAWWLARACEVPQARVAAVLDMTPAAVSRTLSRWESRCQRHPELSAWARQLEARRNETRHAV